MKYIRTKDEIGILIEETDDKELQEKKIGVNNMLFKTWYGNDESKIIKQADTIEELCDEFVSVRDNWHDHWDNFEEPKTLCSESEIYGAIWTDKGLIYVAKINEKGELELL